MADHFNAVLSALMSTDNATRKNAETHFNNLLQTNAPGTLETLVVLFTTPNADLVLRSFSGILIRRGVENYSDNVSPEQINSFRDRWLAMWATETNHLLFLRLSHIMAQSALKSPWNELVPRIVQSTNNSNPKSLIAVLNLIEILSEYCPEDIQANLAVLVPFMGQFIASQDTAVQIACAKATGACIISLDDEAARNTFKPAVLPIVNVLSVALSSGDEADATKIMSYLVTVAQEQPNFFKGTLDAIVGAMLSVANAQGLEFSTRSMALELLVTITETAPALARRSNGLIQGLIPLAMSLMLEIDEEEAEWAAGPYTEEPTDENCSVGDEAIERVATGLGGKSISEPVLSLVQQYFTTGKDYKYRRAAVAALCRLAEGSAKHFKKYMPQALQFLAASLQDSSSKVKFEGIQTIGRFATIYPELSAVLIGCFLPQLTVLLHDSHTCDRVRGHAASALINLVNPDSCEKDTLAKYLDPLLQSLLYCLQSAPLQVRAPCLALVGCIATVSGEDFIPYYAGFMPGIISLLREATSPDLAALRGKAMECAGLVGEAVGVQVFAADALQIMQLFMQALQLDTERDSTFDYILPACARISRALTSQFEPFLPALMEPLLAGAKQEIQFSMVDAEEDDIEGEVIQDEETGTESAVVSLGAGVRKRVTLNTHAVQQKNQAARVLYEFATALKGYLKSYILPALQILLTMVTDKHSSDIRSSATLAMAKMFDAFVHAIQLGFIQNNPAQNISLDAVLSGCLSKLLEAVREEADPTARACAAEALRDVLQACYLSGTEAEDGSRSNFLVKPDITTSEKLVKEVLTRCAESLLRRHNKNDAIQKNDGYDDEDRAGVSEELAEEDDLLTTYADTFGQLLKIHGEPFMVEFDHFIAPAFSPHLRLDEPEPLQIVAVYLVDDVVEFGGSAAQKYIPMLIPTFMHNAKSENTLLRQSSVYGLAKALLTAPALLCPQLSAVIARLIEVLNDCAEPESGDEGDEGAGEGDLEGTFENAVFALGTIATGLGYRDTVVAMGPGSVEHLMTTWLQRLPLKTDEAQAKLASKQLCDSIERNDPFIIGQDGANLPEILRTLAETLQSTTAGADATVMAHPVTLGRIQNIVKTFRSSGNPAVGRAVAELSPELQQVLNSVV